MTIHALHLAYDASLAKTNMPRANKKLSALIIGELWKICIGQCWGKCCNSAIRGPEGFPLRSLQKFFCEMPVNLLCNHFVAFVAEVIRIQKDVILLVHLVKDVGKIDVREILRVERL